MVRTFSDLSQIRHHNLYKKGVYVSVEKTGLYKFMTICKMWIFAVNAVKLLVSGLVGHPWRIPKKTLKKMTVKHQVLLEIISSK